MRSRWIVVFAGLLIVCVGLPAWQAAAVVSQLGGTVVPTGSALRNELIQHEGDPSVDASALDAVLDAQRGPQIFLPPEYGSGHVVIFTDILEGSPSESSFGWYNAGDPSRLFRIFACGSEPDATAIVDFDQEHDNGSWDGGHIGFYLITPEGNGGVNCGDFSPPVNFGHIYLTEQDSNGDGSYVHNLVYSSNKNGSRFYFAFEDLFRGGNDDFTDMVVKAEGLTPVCVAQAEMCDAVDNDCDGAVDDDPVDAGGSCGEELGECVAGTLECAGGQLSCQGGTGPVAEQCDGLDNDCDGLVDGFTRDCYSYASGCVETAPGQWACDGLCLPGLQLCPIQSGGQWDPCQGALGPVAEQCDGLDNDCDGLVDADALGAPLTQACYPPGSGPTTGCVYDAGADAWLCAGECAAGTRQCVSGAWEPCAGAVTPTMEVCNTLDDDCDGLTDESEDIPGMSQPCGIALGQCTPGVLQCAGGMEVCVGGTGPFEGECNGLDDDCDGQTDEPDEVADEEGLPCGDATGCSPGQTLCVGGEILCVGQEPPPEEVCNGLDDDCDGVIDDGVLCPEGWLCYDADCRKLCDPTNEFPCPPGGVCTQITLDGTDYYICMPELCGPVVCPDGLICIDDECVDPCTGMVCEPWQRCDGGMCIDLSCTGMLYPCGPGQLCVAHQCVTDPCRSLECGEQEYCRPRCNESGCEGASCEPLCYCPPGWLCDTTGGCSEDLCLDSFCDLGDRCSRQTGLCEPDPCVEVAYFCAPYEICLEGECVADPCRWVDCPAFFECEVVPGTDAFGAVVPVPVCHADPQYWVDEDAPEEPEPGCGCRSTGSGSSGAALLMVLVMLCWLRRRRATTRRAARLGAVILALALGGCGGGGDRGSGPWGHWEIPDAGSDAEPDTTVPVDACVVAQEVCDGSDNDCDGVVDNVDPALLADDVENCGACGNDCTGFPFAEVRCELGQCVLVCNPPYYDLNDDPLDGCEYQCFVTGGGTEICNGLDDDCDGEIDEGFDLTSDPENCGACLNNCWFFQGVGECVTGLCLLVGCEGGHIDLDGDSLNGCECGLDVVEGPTSCDVTVPGSCAVNEICADVSQDGVAHCCTIPLDGCDGVDNDCDGQVDEDAASLLHGEQCYSFGVGCVETAPGVFACTGECQAGEPVCQDGNVVCAGDVGPAPEACDELDHDCDGATDNGLDLQNDPVNCGVCGVQCAAIVPHAYALCTGGGCVVDVCHPGHWDLNGDPADGCEHACQASNGGVEVCDGVDNDCDGEVDLANCLAASAEVRLDTSSPAGAANSIQVDLAADGDVIHVVWLDRRNGNADIYHSCSTDGGQSFTVDSRLDIGSSDSVQPRVLMQPGGTGRVFVVYEDFRSGNDRDVYLRASAGCGYAFEPELRLDSGDLESRGIDLVASATGPVAVVWEDYIEPSGLGSGYRNVYLAVSDDAGASFGSPVRVSQAPVDPTQAFATDPRVALGAAGRILVAWEDRRDGQGDVYVNYTDDAGASFLPADLRLDSDPAGAGASSFPRLVSDGAGGVFVVWQDERSGVSADVFFRRSADNGASWLAPEIQLDDEGMPHDSASGRVALGGAGLVYVAWVDHRDGLPQLRMATSIDAGASFAASVRASAGNGRVAEPCLAVDGSGLVFVAFTDDRDGLTDIYLSYSNDGGLAFAPGDLRVDLGSLAGADDSFGVRLAAGPSGVAYLVWADTRSSGLFGDIYFNRVD